MENGNTQGGFDPMTGEPMESAPAGGFDPMTGEPVAAPSAGGFDPMTGKPIESAPSGGFDPMTGEPVGKSSNTGFDPMTGKPLKKKVPVFVPVIIAVIAIAGIVAGLILSGVLGSKHTKILLASANTVKEGSRLYNDLKIADIYSWMNNRTIGAEFSAEIESMEMSGSYSFNKGDQQLYAAFTTKSLPEFSGTVEYGKDTVNVQVPIISDDIISYNFREKKKGFLEEYADEDDLEKIDNALSTIRDLCGTDSEFESESKKLVFDAYKKFKVTSIPKKKLEINEKEVNCSGYKINIPYEVLEDLAYDYQDLSNKYFEDLYKSAGISRNMDDYFKSLRKAARSFDSIDITVYIYKNMLAQVNVGGDDVDVLTLLFKGGEKRMDNMELRVKTGRETVRIRQTCSRDGSEYTYKYTAKSSGDTANLFNIKYDSSSGDMRISSDFMDENFRCNLSSSSDSVTLSFRNIPYKDLDGKMSITINKGVSIGKLSGKVVDLTTIEEDEIKEKLEEYQETVEDLVYEYDLDEYFMNNYSYYGRQLERMLSGFGGFGGSSATAEAPAAW